MTTSNPIIREQAPINAPQGENVQRGTNLILPPNTLAERLTSFPEEIYDIRPSSHVWKFVSALMGDSGVGQIHKRNTLARLQSSAEGTSFYDLDRFYGALFGVRRQGAERPEIDPYSDVATSQEWDEVDRADGSYRSRVTQFARALQYGATALGMELIAEAILSVDCEVAESFVTADVGVRTYADMEADFTDYGDIDGRSYDSLERTESEVPNYSANRWTFDIIVKRPITQEERYDLTKILDRVKPAHALLKIKDVSQTNLEEVGISSTSADSEHWEVRSRTVTKDGVEGAYVVAGTSEAPEEQRRPPYSGYQGETWSLVPEVLGTISYSETGAGKITEGLYERIIFPNSIKDYVPSLAVRSPQDINAGRLASDGVFASHFFSRNRSSTTEDFGHSSIGHTPDELNPYVGSANLAPAYFDGMSLEQLLALAPDKLSLIRQQTEPSARFWSTPPAPAHRLDWEVIEIRLNSPQRLNFFSFEIPHFPMRCEFQYRNPASGEWDTLHRIDISDSFPSAIVSRSESFTQEHPQHGVNGHWVRVEEKISPVQAQDLRVRMRRNAAGTLPVDSQRNPIDYSLGLRGFDAGYRISSRKDIPRQPAGVENTVGSSLDILGSRVFFDVQEKLASNLTNESNDIWLSEPQPISEAVVSLFLDMRTQDGKAQEVDRFFVDPIYSGPRINLYYSNDTPALLPFTSTDDIITPESNGADYFPDVTPRGLRFPSGQLRSLTLANQQVQWRIEEHWSLALELEPFQDSEQALAPIFSFDGNFVCLGGGGLSFHPKGFDPIPLVAPFNANDNLHLILSHDPESGQSTIEIKTPLDTHSVSFDTFFTNSGSLNFGTNEDLALGYGYLLKNVALKQDFIPISMTEWENPSNLTVKSEYRTAEDPDSLLIRYSPALASTDNPYGFRGGPGSFYEQMTWTPIPRDYTLAKGYLGVPPTLAKFWKFEFSGLVARPYEVFEPMERLVKIFPPEVLGQSSYRRNISGYEDWPGITTAVGTSIPFSDSPSTATPPDTLGYKPTEALSSTEIDSASRLRQISWSYGFVPWHIGDKTPRFSATDTHRYTEISIYHTQKLAFFVGLRNVKAYRSPYTVADNHQAIIERFWSDKRITPGGSWSLTPGLLETGTRSFATTSSQTVQTRSNVEGIQFASQQTPAVQLLFDDGFQNPGHALNQWDGGLGWKPYGDGVLYYSPLDTSVIIARSARAISAIDSADSGVSNDPLHPVFSLYDREFPPTQLIGGIESLPVEVSQKGSIHAAVRVTGITDIIENPLWLQIVAENGTVLKEKPITVKAGDTVSEINTYILGSYNDGYLPQLERRNIVEEPVNTPFAGEDELQDLGIDVGAAIAAGTIVYVRLTQKNPSTDAWKVHRLSLYDDSIFWEFSSNGGATWTPAYGIRNNPNGVLTFPVPGNALRWRVSGYRSQLNITSLQIRPIYEGLGATQNSVAADRGPNLSLYDSSLPIDLDPEFQNFGVIPLSWYDTERPSGVGRDQVYEDVITQTTVQLDIRGIALDPETATFSEYVLVEDDTPTTINVGVTGIYGLTNVVITGVNPDIDFDFPGTEGAFAGGNSIDALEDDYFTVTIDGNVGRDTPITFLLTCDQGYIIFSVAAWTLLDLYEDLANSRIVDDVEGLDGTYWFDTIHDTENYWIDMKDLS